MWDKCSEYTLHNYQTAVLVAIAIPVFTSQLEKSREATDAANIRSAYAEITVLAIDDDTTKSTKDVSLRQTQSGWQNEDGNCFVSISFSHAEAIPAPERGMESPRHYHVIGGACHLCLCQRLLLLRRGAEKPGAGRGVPHPVLRGGRSRS